MNELLVADVGGTGTRFARCSAGGKPGQIATYLNTEFASFEALLDDYLSRSGSVPDAAAFAVAGPVANQEVHMTNLGWHLSASQLQRDSGIAGIEIMNDFAALAWATLSIPASEVVAISGGQADPRGNRVVLGPGTGLGMGALVGGPGHWQVVAGEGGHVTMPAYTAEEAQLIADVFREFGHCSAERLLSGSGLARIYSFVGGGAAAPHQVTERGRAGEAAACEALELFNCMLGTVAANAALTFGSVGGVYLAGGILPAIADTFIASGFRRRFEEIMEEA